MVAPPIRGGGHLGFLHTQQKGKMMKAKRHPRTAKEIAQDPRVEDMYKEDGSWWVHLKNGFVCSAMECGTIRENTISEVCQMMKEIVTTEEFDKNEMIPLAGLRMTKVSGGDEVKSWENVGILEF